MTVAFDSDVTLEVSIGFASDPSVAIASTTWTDVSADVRSCDTDSGRQYELDRFEAGTATIVLDNRGREYDPTNTSSPHSPNVKPMRRVRIRATHNAITYDMWAGFIESIDLEYPTPKINAGDAIAVVQCVDALESLALADLPESPWAFEIRKTFEEQEGAGANFDAVWFRLNESEAGGTRAVNSFGDTGRDGTYEGSTSGTGLVFKSGDGARTFDHSKREHVYFPTIFGASGVYPFIIEAFIQTNATAVGTEPDDSVIVAALPNKETLDNDQLIFAVNTAGKLVVEVRDVLANSRSAVSTTAIDDGKVHHVVARCTSASSFAVWIDGANDTASQQTTGTGTPAAPNTFASPMTIGPSDRSKPPDTPVEPYTIDEVVIWYDTNLSDATLVRHAKAGLDTANGTRLDVAWGDELSGTRVDRICTDWLAIPLADLDTDAGNSELGPTDLGGSALEYLQKIAESEYGGFYIGRDGKVRFRQRHALLTTAKHTTSQATFGDGAGELDYRALSLPTDLTRVFNHVTVQREDGVERVASDETSIDKFRKRTLSRTGLLHASDLESQDAADWLLGHFKDPDTRVDAIEITPRRDPANLWPEALGRELEDRVTVKRQPPGGGTISKEVLIQRISHGADAPTKSWVTRFQLSAADTRTYWILGHATFGKLGSTSRLAY